MESTPLAALSGPSPTPHAYAHSARAYWAGDALGEAGGLSPSPVITPGPTSTPRSPPSRPPPRVPSSSPPRRCGPTSTVSSSPSPEPYSEQSGIYEDYSRSPKDPSSPGAVSLRSPHLRRSKSQAKLEEANPLRRSSQYRQPSAWSSSTRSQRSDSAVSQLSAASVSSSSLPPPLPSSVHLDKALPLLAQPGVIPKSIRAGMPTYVEGEEWIVRSVRAIGYKKKEEDAKWMFCIGVVRESVRADGTWAKEVEYRVWRKWDALVGLREAIVRAFPRVDASLPRLTRSKLFTRSSRTTQENRFEELEPFLAALFRLNHQITDCGPVREMFSRDGPLTGPVPYVADVAAAAIKRAQNLERVQHAGLPLQMLRAPSSDDHRVLRKKGSAPLLSQFARIEPNENSDTATIRPQTQKVPVSAHCERAESKPARPRPHRSITISEYHGSADLRTPTATGRFPPVDFKGSVPSSRSPSRVGTAAPVRPMLRPSRSMGDVRAAAQPFLSPSTSIPPAVPAIPSRYGPLRDAGQAAAMSSSTESLARVSLDRGRSGHAVVAAAAIDGSPRRHRRNGATSSSVSSSGSFSFGSYADPSVLGLSLSNRSTSTESLIYSDSSIASPKVPNTPPTVPISLDGSDRCGKYYYDQASGQYVPNTSLPPTPFFGLPPVSTPAAGSPTSETTIVAPLVAPSRSSDSVRSANGSKRHGYVGHGMERSRSGSASQVPRLSTIIASPNVDIGAFAQQTVPEAVATPKTVESMAPIASTITVKVLHEQTNVQIKVPRDTPLPRLCSKIAHKYSEGAGISLSRDGDYDWKLVIVGRSQDGEPSRSPPLDEEAWKAVQEGLNRIIVRAV